MPPSDGGMPENHISRCPNYFNEGFLPGPFSSVTAILKAASVSGLAFFLKKRKNEIKEDQPAAMLLTWTDMVKSVYPHLIYYTNCAVSTSP